jgi:TPR repeat protein
MLITGLAMAGPSEDAKQAYDRGDYKTAYRLNKSLAERGSSVAQSNLGLMYYHSRGVSQDYGEAMKWFRKAADQEDAVGQYYIGLMYYNGKTVPQNYAEATKWFRRAADQGDADSQYSLGLMYAIGKGVPQDYVLAYMWLNLASTRDSAWEKEKRDKAKENRENLASKLTSAQVAEAQKLAREWKLKKEK